MITFGFGLVSYHNKKGELHRYGLLALLGDLTAFSVFALILVLAQVPVFDPRTGDYADGDSFGRLVFGLIVFSIFFGIAYGVLRFKSKP
jgi:hypothetical protein